jgi:hypothetical protein
MSQCLAIWIHSLIRERRQIRDVGAITRWQRNDAHEEGMALRRRLGKSLALGALGAVALTSALAQDLLAQDLDVGKSPAQIFAEACAACHRSPRQLRNNASAAFLREHYTTGSRMAAAMAGYIAAVGVETRAAPPVRPPAVNLDKDLMHPPADIPAQETTPRRTQNGVAKPLRRGPENNLPRLPSVLPEAKETGATTPPPTARSATATTPQGSPPLEPFEE